VPAQRVAFGTSGHRGSSLENGFNETHILAITQAICLYRKQQHIDGPLFIGIDTHALSEPAFASALEVLAANGVDVMVDGHGGYTPTPVISHAVLTYNRGRRSGLADGIVVTPSHNPPRFGGFKYNPPTGGPADTHVTQWIEQEANGLIADGLRGVARIPFERARKAATTQAYDYLIPTWPICRRSWTWKRCERARFASALIRWAAPALRIGMRSASATVSTSRSSTTPSTRRFDS
jgi:phosphoglucomutase